MSISPKKTATKPAIGNDVVDLKDTDSLDILQNHPFLQRVFTENELEFIHNANNPRAKAWGLWAAKESAYKTARQLNAKTIFSPKLYEVDPIKCIVIRDKKSFIFTKTETTDYVHTESILQEENNMNNSNKNKKRTWIQSLQELIDNEEINIIADNIKAYNEQSGYCRAFATWLLRNELGLPDGYIHKESLGPRCPPELYNNQQKITDSAISLSHHGRFCAVAICGNLIKS